MAASCRRDLEILSRHIAKRLPEAVTHKIRPTGIKFKVASEQHVCRASGIDEFMAAPYREGPGSAWGRRGYDVDCIRIGNEGERISSECPKPHCEECILKADCPSYPFIVS